MKAPLPSPFPGIGGDSYTRKGTHRHNPKRYNDSGTGYATLSVG